MWSIRTDKAPKSGPVRLCLRHSQPSGSVASCESLNITTIEESLWITFGSISPNLTAGQAGEQVLGVIFWSGCRPVFVGGECLRDMWELTLYIAIVKVLLLWGQQVLQELLLKSFDTRSLQTSNFTFAVGNWCINLCEWRLLGSHNPASLRLSRNIHRLLTSHRVAEASRRSSSDTSLCIDVGSRLRFGQGRFKVLTP